MQDSKFLSCSLQDRSLLSCKVQAAGLLLSILQDSNFLLCYLENNSFLSCNVQDSSFQSCNLQDGNFLLCNLHDRNFVIENLVDGDVVEAGLNLGRSYLWWFRNLACGNLIGTKGIENGLIHGSSGLASKQGLVWLSVSGVLIWSGRKTVGLVSIFLSFAVLNSWWWVVAWRFYLFFSDIN